MNYTISEVDPSKWENRKLALENDITNSNLTISEYYLNNLKQNPNYRIKQRIVDRKFYQKELEKIWKKQEEEFYKEEFNDKSKIEAIAKSLYHHNVEKQRELIGKGLFHILVNDIIYFQRGLKSQKDPLEIVYMNRKPTLIKMEIKLMLELRYAIKAIQYFKNFEYGKQFII